MAEAKAPAATSRKNEDKKKQGKPGAGAKEKLLVLTPSEIALGIRITQPKQKNLDTMTRLYAVPSEKLRVWTCWLTKVGERSEDWQWWLRAQIALTLRISDHLQRAVVSLEAERGEKLEEEDGEVAEVATMSEEVSEKTTTEAKTADSPEEEMPGTKDDVPEELANNVVPEEPEEESEGKRSKGKGDKDKGKGRRRAGKLEPKIVYKEGFWPIGVRWKPLSQRGGRKSAPHREPEEIPIPETEEAMMKLIRQIRHQGVLYRSLYKHWSQTADQAVKEMLGRTVLPTKKVYFNGEEVPYFFYLNAEADVDFAIEHDDEEVLLADPGRERITREFTHVYFNLLDKPGKGGKPWI